MLKRLFLLSIVSASVLLSACVSPERQARKLKADAHKAAVKAAIVSPETLRKNGMAIVAFETKYFDVGAEEFVNHNITATLQQIGGAEHETKIVTVPHLIWGTSIRVAVLPAGNYNFSGINYKIPGYQYDYYASVDFSKIRKKMGIEALPEISVKPGDVLNLGTVVYHIKNAQSSILYTKEDGYWYFSMSPGSEAVDKTIAEDYSAFAALIQEKPLTCLVCPKESTKVTIKSE